MSNNIDDALYGSQLKREVQDILPNTMEGLFIYYNKEERACMISFGLTMSTAAHLLAFAQAQFARDVLGLDREDDNA